MSDYINGVYTNLKTGETISFNYDNMPTMTALQMFVDKVVNIIVPDLSYHPLLRDIMFDYILINDFSDIDLSIMDNANAEDVEEYIAIITAPFVIKNAWGVEKINLLNKAIDDGIAFRLGFRPNSILPKIEGILDYILKYLEDLSENDIVDFIRAVGNINGELTPEKLLESYANSDVIKELYEQTDKRRADQNEKLIEVLKELQNSRK